MGFSIKSINTGLGITSKYYGFDVSDKLAKAAKTAVGEIQDRFTKSGQFLKWVELPEQQQNKLQKFLMQCTTVLKHTLMLQINLILH